MRRGHHSPATGRGFTLIEIVLVLAVAALLVGGALSIMVISDDGRILNRSTVELEVLAKRARTLATLQQRPYALEFHEQTITLMPLAEAMLDPRDRERARERNEMAAAESAETEPTSAAGFAPIHAFWTVGDEMRIFVRRWASDQWLPVDTKNRHVWRFDPAGFTEPIGVRFTLGDSWQEAEFHPLTGGIRYESQEIY